MDIGAVAAAAISGAAASAAAVEGAAAAAVPYATHQNFQDCIREGAVAKALEPKAVMETGVLGLCSNRKKQFVVVAVAGGGDVLAELAGGPYPGSSASLLAA